MLAETERVVLSFSLWKKQLVECKSLKGEHEVYTTGERVFVKLVYLTFTFMCIYCKCKINCAADATLQSQKFVFLIFLLNISYEVRCFKQKPQTFTLSVFISAAFNPLKPKLV
jgi:hypothetical protein